MPSFLASPPRVQTVFHLSVQEAWLSEPAPWEEGRNRVSLYRRLLVRKAVGRLEKPGHQRNPRSTYSRCSRRPRPQPPAPPPAARARPLARDLTPAPPRPRPWTRPLPATPPPAARSPAQAPPARRHNVPAGARACTLIPRLPAPATLAPGRRRATRVHLPAETPFALGRSGAAQAAGSDAPCARTGVPGAKRPLARPLAAAVTPGRRGPRTDPGSLRVSKDVPRSSSPCGETPSLAPLHSDLLMSGGRRSRSRSLSL